jgi:hypothetical protein
MLSCDKVLGLWRWLRLGVAAIWFVTALMLQTLSAQGAKVKLGWDANTEADLAGYRVHYGPSAGDYPNSVDVGNVTTAEIEGLVAGQQYWFVVTAYNVSGLESETSNEITFTVAFQLERGIYLGLVGEDGGSTRASITVVLGVKGKATGRIRIGAKQYGWKGTFGSDGRLVTSIPRGGGLAAMTLTLQLAGGGSELGGTLTDGTSFAEVNGNRATFGKGIEASQKGRYTAFFRESDAAESDGYGYAMLNVSTLGSVRTLGVLPDGSPVVSGVRLDNAGDIPVFVFLPKTKATLFGRIHFRDVSDQSDADGVMVWSDPAKGVSDLQFYAARHQPPAPGTILGALSLLVGGTEISLWSSGLSIVAGVLNAIGPNRFVAAAPLGEVFTVNVSQATGRFTGSCQLIGATALLEGIVYAKGSVRGYGRVRNTGNRIELQSFVD